MRKIYEEFGLRFNTDYGQRVSDVWTEQFGRPPEWVKTAGDMVRWFADMGEHGYAAEVNASVAFAKWKHFGCPVFTVDTRTVDLFCCTEPSKEVYLPYPAFAVDLPYDVRYDEKEVFSSAIVQRFINRDTRVEEWQLVTKTSRDVPGQVSIANGGHALTTLLDNLCAFLAGCGAVKEEARHMRHVAPAKNARAPVNVWRLDPPLVTSIPVGCARKYIRAGELPPRTFKIGKRFMVRGHWRNQACGKGMQDRKKLWVQPYLKGPDDAEAWSRVYKVKGQTA